MHEQIVCMALSFGTHLHFLRFRVLFMKLCHQSFKQPFNTLRQPYFHSIFVSRKLVGRWLLFVSMPFNINVLITFWKLWLELKKFQSYFFSSTSLQLLCMFFFSFFFLLELQKYIEMQFTISTKVKYHHEILDYWYQLESNFKIHNYWY